MKKLKPVIKWSGSKRSQAEQILQFVPSEVETYIEPFVGGGSILGALMVSENHKVGEYQISDYNETLIGLWNAIKDTPEELHYHYKELWVPLHEAVSIDDKKVVYNSVRSRLNEFKNPRDFMFIMRTCVNGMPRYNSSGGFNSPYHLNRGGIKPETLKSIILQWSELLNTNKVTFTHKSYESVVAKKDSFMYLDPPYANTKGMYFDNFDVLPFFEWLEVQDSKYLLSFDGKSGEIDSTYSVPEKLYDKHVYLQSGNSSFKRLMTDNKSANVQESLYIKI